jgi:hypothetical protein
MTTPTATLLVNARSRRDLVTNPAYDEVLAELRSLADAETSRLAVEGRESDLSRINWQSGVLEGAKRAIEMLSTYRKAAMNGAKTTSVE